MTTLNYTPDWGAKKQNKPRANKIQFGDGYEQRITDGLNSNMEVWSVTFKRAKAEIDIIDDFLSDRSAVEAFNWVNPNGHSIVVKCEEWDTSYDSPGYDTLTATFTQVPEKVGA